MGIYVFWGLVISGVIIFLLILVGCIMALSGDISRRLGE